MKTKDAFRLRSLSNPNQFIGFIYPSNTPILCQSCRREIRYGDDTKVIVVYEGNDPVEVLVHVHCSDVSDRPRLPTPEPEYVITTRGTRRKIMATKAKGGKKTAAKTEVKKTRKQKVEEEDEELETQVEPDEADEEEEEEDEVEADNEDEAEDEDEGDDEDEEEEDDEEEDEPPAKSKGKGSAKSQSKSKGKDKATKKTSGSKGGKKKGDFAKTTGAEILPLLPEGTPKKVRRVAEDLSKGKTVDNAALVSLRDGIKKATKELRNNKQGSKASKLSALNSRVRRLERESRP